MAVITNTWNDSMPGSDTGITNTFCLSPNAVATCNGYAFMYDFVSKSAGTKNELKGVGNGEVRIAFDSSNRVFYFGCNGHVQAVPFNKFSTCLWASPLTLPDAGETVTSVLVADNGMVYAGANGYAYKINPDGQIVYSNSMDGVGKNEVRLALSIDQRTLFVGTNGRIVALSTDKMEILWQLILPAWDYGGSVSNTVSLLSTTYNDPSYGGSTPWLFAGCNGWIYAIDMSSPRLTPRVSAMTSMVQNALGKGDTRLAYKDGILYVGLSGCAAALDASLRRPLKWTYQETKAASRVANVVVGETQVFLGSAGVVAVIVNGKCMGTSKVTNGGSNPVGLSFDPQAPTRLIAGANGYVSAYSIQSS